MPWVQPCILNMELGPDETELEGKIILDKQVGRTLHAFNIVGEYEFEKEFESENGSLEAETEREAYFELDYAFSFRIKDGFALGLEARNQNQFSASNELESSVLSLGPVLFLLYRWLLAEFHTYAPGCQFKRRGTGINRT